MDNQQLLENFSTFLHSHDLIIPKAFIYSFLEENNETKKYKSKKTNKTKTNKNETYKLLDDGSDLISSLIALANNEQFDIAENPFADRIIECPNAPIKQKRKYVKKAKVNNIANEMNNEI
jgi:hypothetical protein